MDLEEEDWQGDCLPATGESTSQTHTATITVSVRRIKSSSTTHTLNLSFILITHGLNFICFPFLLQGELLRIDYDSIDNPKPIPINPS